MPAVTIEVPAELGRPLSASSGSDLSWQAEFALGDTLGRLFARLSIERPGFVSFYDPSTRRLADRVGLTVNGRNYQLVGGVTYLLRDGDRLTLASGPVDLGSRD